MKKIGAILLLAIFLGFSTGYVVAKHYCGGTLMSTEIVFAKDHVSCCDDDDMDENCCQNEVSFFQIDEDYCSTPLMGSTTPIDFVLIGFASPSFYCISNANPVAYLNYKPPLIEVNHPVQLQSFLL